MGREGLGVERGGGGQGWSSGGNLQIDMHTEGHLVTVRCLLIYTCITVFIGNSKNKMRLHSLLIQVGFASLTTTVPQISSWQCKCNVRRPYNHLLCSFRLRLISVNPLV